MFQPQVMSATADDQEGTRNSIDCAISEKRCACSPFGDILLEVPGESSQRNPVAAGRCWWSTGVRERRPDLIGQQHSHPELFDRRADDASRGREDKLTVNKAALSDDEADLLVRGQTVSLDVHAV